MPDNRIPDSSRLYTPQYSFSPTITASPLIYPDSSPASPTTPPVYPDSLTMRSSPDAPLYPDSPNMPQSPDYPPLLLYPDKQPSPDPPTPQYPDSTNSIPRSSKSNSKGRSKVKSGKKMIVHVELTARKKKSRPMKKSKQVEFRKFRRLGDVREIDPKFFFVGNQSLDHSLFTDYHCFVLSSRPFSN